MQVALKLKPNVFKSTDPSNPYSGASKIDFIKALRELTHYGLKEAKDIADGLLDGRVMTIETRECFNANDALTRLAAWVAGSPLPDSLTALLAEYRQLGPPEKQDGEDEAAWQQRYANRHILLYGYDYRKTATWRRGRIDFDCLGWRVVNTATNLGRLQLKPRRIWEYLDKAGDALYADGPSRHRSAAHVGVGLLCQLDQRTSGDSQKLAAANAPYPTASELLIREAAKLLLEAP